jgi:hypothetical protein
MVRHFSESEFEYGFGLIGSPLRKTVIKEMEDGLSAPDCPVTGMYLSILTSCAFAQQQPIATTPSPDETDKEKLQLQQEKAKKASAVRESIKEEYLKQLAAAVPSKTGAAKAISLDTLRNNLSNRTK